MRRSLSVVVGRNSSTQVRPVKYARAISFILLISSIVFFLITVYLANLGRYVSSLLSLTSGMVLLSSALGVFREISEKECEKPS